ncbi:MAG TPA: putative porin [Pyrinomonadaceae bacterium]|nr:putative porin [Pyrinomonadaceae bacterium]
MRQLIPRACALAALVAFSFAGASAQTTVDAEKSATQAKTSGSLFALEEVERQLRAQREEIEQLRAAVKEQSRLIDDLRSRVEGAERLAGGGRGNLAAVRDASYADAPAPAPAEPRGAAAGKQGGGLEARVARVEKTAEAVSKQVGSMTFGGDVRFRYESFYGQQNALANPEAPGTFGNPLSTRQRLRLRARFNVRGKVSDEFEWGLRLATGTYADAISTNQTLTDFFTRKPVALDYAYLVYRPKGGNFFVDAGKLDSGRRFTPKGTKDELDAFWTRTELTWDADINPEGLLETYAFAFGKKNAKGEIAPPSRGFRNLVLQAWQLPMLERNSAVILGADGKVDLSASGRAGRDLALYGAQVRTELALSDRLSLRLSASDLYFSGTQFITPAQVFGSNIQFPVTVVIPASGTTPARTVTTQVSVPRDLLVSGNPNLGLSLANTNAVNRDGRLSSGYNLLDFIARLDYRRTYPGDKHTHWPVMVLFDFVTNTRTRDVVTAGPAGADVLLPNDQGQGYWAEFRVGREVTSLRQIERGDKMFDYAFIRIEKDAVLSPFNGSDLGLSTDVRVHRLIAAYALDPKVAVSLTGFFTQRPTGLLGAFGQTPPGSLNRTQTRLQFDTILRF